MTPDQHRAEAERLIAVDDIHDQPTAGNIALAQVHALLAAQPALPDLARVGLRATVYAVTSEAILYMTGERDEVGFKDFDHDDIAESVTQSVMSALEGRHPEVRG